MSSVPTNSSVNDLADSSNSLVSDISKLWVISDLNSDQNSSANRLAITCKDFLMSMGYEVRLPESTQTSLPHPQTALQTVLETISQQTNNQSQDLVLVNTTTLSELIQAKSLYHLGFDHCEDAILAYEVFNDGSFSSYREVNSSACKLLGYSRAELLGLSPQQIDLTTANPSLSDGKNSSDRLFLTKSGEKILVVLTVKVSVIQAKRIALTFIKPIVKPFTLEQDITEQEVAKSALQELNQALETKVKIRTAELVSVNHKLTREIEERQRIEHSLSFHLKRVETAYRMVFAMNQAETLEDIYSRSLRGLASIFQISRLGILIADDQGVMRFKITRGLSDSFRQTVEKLAQNRSRDPGDNTTQPMIYYDTVDLPFPKILQSAMESEAIEAMVVFPLIHGGLVIGEIVIYSDRSLELTQEEVQIGKTIATYIAVAITRKQTEISLRKSEGQFRQIFRDASIGMALANIRTRRFTKVNSALCQMLDFSEAEFLTLVIDDITHPQDLSQDMRHLLQASYGQIESYRLEKRFLKKDNQILWASSTVTVLRDTDGHPTSILIMIEDTSDRKAAETQTRKTEALRLELDKEKELNSLRTRFFSMASHEFRTPIGAILMNANILEYANDTPLNQKSLRSLQRIRANVKHLISLLDDVLTINRADTGRLEFQPQLQDVRDLCSRVIEELFTEDTHFDRVKFQTEGDRQYLAMIDEKLFHHMLTNLLANALKYSDPKSEVLIDLSAKELGKISIQIRDRGIGIGEKDVPHLFDAFYRGENVGKVTGSGLGLTIVKKSVEMHGGEIEVKSQVGIGTCFNVILPSDFP